MESIKDIENRLKLYSDDELLEVYLCYFPNEFTTDREEMIRKLVLRRM